MKTKILTQKSFEKWGQFFDAGDEEKLQKCDGFNYAGNTAVFQAMGECSISVLEPVMREKVLKCMEMHKETEEVCIAIEKDCIITVAKGDEKGPDTETLEAFVLREGCTVIYKAGTWHWVPFPIDSDVCKQLIIYKNHTGDNDFYMEAVNPEISLEV